MYSAVEEAAILYASNYPDQSAALLLDYIKSSPERKELQPWLMLFDIYQIQDAKHEFDELAMEFIVKFERSAPIWSDAKVPGANAGLSSGGSLGHTTRGQVAEGNPKTGAAAEAYVSLTGVLRGDKESLFQNLVQAAQKSSGLRVDFSRLEGVDASGSRRLVETMQGLIKSGKKITPINIPHLTSLLVEMIGQGGEDEQAHWLLLLNLYQCQGMQAEFEDLAVEYAINFEVSPPSWEPCRQVAVASSPSPVPDDEVLLCGEENMFFLSGVISTASASQFKELGNFAASRGEVYLDMTQVPRVDFGSLGDFSGMLAGLHNSGKKVLIHNANEMIRALLSVMDVDQHVTILRRKIG